ncbi:MULTISPECIES: glycoside hydrolase family 3 protein [Bifidobacterium]|uniref:beta-glucosidase n=1 Tax=Bifidobacterium tissieri TaxID=1630162 RepID=A0A5M9ZZU7_9BIFI|nr:MULTISPECIES: glycoside hydrolase family 3 N-terminal domain-containing protein [Bifidobacterium]KAA8831220.1 glycoside hydrolase family 3 protein [Bifidobacterium tissieri]KAA8833126.1 glycoside hydrolase family 3 protein [Bifidobacterium tissieri]TPF97845.1 glycoside hydrolase [Bifidobacterium sp. UTCIF-39]
MTTTTATTKASDIVKYYDNQDGPTIGVVSKPVIEQDGLYFKDLDGSGKLDDYKDWRKSPAERAASLVKELTVDEKIGMIFTNSWRMGQELKDGEQRDETGLLSEQIVEEADSIFSAEKTWGTKYSLQTLKLRNLILRANPTTRELVDWINQLNAVAEETEHGVPVQVLSNSRNENGEAVFGMNEAQGVFATWPGTLGIAAAVIGTGDMGVIDRFGNVIRREWDAVGMKKGYMYMADTMTDPRWQRTYGTFSENPKLNSDIFDHLIPAVQGGDELTRDGVAMTVKHFPGGGARENGFDPHYAEGQWNVYQTENSLETYHLPAFKVAVARNAASIMPYYAKPSKAKSAEQYDLNGKPIDWQPVGFAFNEFFIQRLLRGQMGFKGYVNSDSGITHMMAWGVEDLSVPERVALAINNGVDVISGAFSVTEAKEAYERAHNDYYDTHDVPEGYTREQVTLGDEALDRAVTRTLTEKFTLGLFDNPYRDPSVAESVVATPGDWDEAYEVHCDSVTLLKNADRTLPIDAEKTDGRLVYAEAFGKDKETGEKSTASLHAMLESDFGLTLTDDPAAADYALLYADPRSGNYFSATKGYLEIDVCENKTVCDTDPEGRPSSEGTHEETTLYGVGRIAEIADAVHAHGGKVIASLNVSLAWMPGNIERHVDALVAGYDTYTKACVDVIVGRHPAVGCLPITLPKDDSVIAVNADGVCVSPNDVPGYDKDKYMSESMKDENGKAYAYRDAEGNYYEYGFGLRY